MKVEHLPVLVEEIMSMLAPAPGSLQIDATVGGGGHTGRILEATDPDGRLLGLDADGAAVARVDGRLRPRLGDRLVLRPANFRELRAVAPDAGFAAVDGLLFDLGLSSFQLAESERGFSFRTGGPLDMRFDTTRGVPASELLATLDARELAALFKRYGEEPQAGRIARAIVASRSTAAIETAEDLAALVQRVAPGDPRKRHRIHPATRVFQALRIAVNNELGVLETGLRDLSVWVKSGGRMAVIAFHSLEDRIVKRYFRDISQEWIDRPEWPAPQRNPAYAFRLITNRPIEPDEEEIQQNSRARSAKLRVIERIS
ncbi:MAG: 16S rRNA (cytosine(1402)-N(4))-methyltransferase RsmH [Gemmatimonadaceae bacterium]